MRRNLWLAIGSIGAGCLAGAAIALWRRYGPDTYLRFNTMFGHARVYQVEDDAGEPVRLLEVGGIVQSGTYLDERYPELVFEYLKCYDAALSDAPADARVCVLGCGGYDYPEHLIASFPGYTVDAVEIDPAITAIARQHFYLDRLIAEYDTEATGRLNLICSDARDHLASATCRYDVIVNDAFDAGTPPAHLTTRAFLQLARDRLKPGGAFATNIVSSLEGPGSAFLHEQIVLMREVFCDVQVIPCDPDSLAEPDNVVVVARRHV